jgi:RNA polymerase II subunit A small phosphatase-like protein
MMPRNLLIFDLDETLVHAAPSTLSRVADFECPPYFVYTRPHVKQMLSAVAPFYDFAVWSSSSRAYVDLVVAKIFGGEFEVKFSWSVERCIQRVDTHSNGYVYIKDLRKVQSEGYDVSQITILDDSPEKIARQPRNHLKIAPYLGQDGDRELIQICELLLARADLSAGFEPCMLIEDALAQAPELAWLPAALACCGSGEWESRAYVRYVSCVDPNQPGSDWQFKNNVVIDHRIFGQAVIDILQGDRVGGIEFVDRIGC